MLQGNAILLFVVRRCSVPRGRAHRALDTITVGGGFDASHRYRIVSCDSDAISLVRADESDEHSSPVPITDPRLIDAARVALLAVAHMRRRRPGRGPRGNRPFHGHASPGRRR